MKFCLLSIYQSINVNLEQEQEWPSNGGFHIAIVIARGDGFKTSLNNYLFLIK